MSQCRVSCPLTMRTNLRAAGSTARAELSGNQEFKCVLNLKWREENGSLTRGLLQSGEGRQLLLRLTS